MASIELDLFIIKLSNLVWIVLNPHLLFNELYFSLSCVWIKSASIKAHKKVEDDFEVIVDFVSEIITCIKDKEKKVVAGDVEKIKTVYDTWVFSKDVNSSNPNWLLIDTIT